MTWRGHLAVLGVLAIGASAGLVLWDGWGAYVWLADAIIWCG